MAHEQKVQISVAEFRALNRCLDNAIADAVASFGGARQLLMDVQAQTLHDRLKGFSDEHRRLVDVAIPSFFAIRSGNVDQTGATAILLMHTLGELRSLSERTLPGVQMISAATVVTSR